MKNIKDLRTHIEVRHDDDWHKPRVMPDRVDEALQAAQDHCESVSNDFSLECEERHTCDECDEDNHQELDQVLEQT
jgi:hypothetical protein